MGVTPGIRSGWWWAWNVIDAKFPFHEIDAPVQHVDLLSLFLYLPAFPPDHEVRIAHQINPSMVTTVTSVI